MNQKRLPNPVALNCREKALEFLSRYDYILCDCDGVLWVNSGAVPGVPQVLNKLRKMGKKIIFATNNSTKTREEFLAKLQKLGYDAHMDELFPTSYSTALYLQRIGFRGKAFVVGCSGISKELAKVGIESSGVGKDPTPDSWAPGFAEFEDFDEDVRAVVVGFDQHVSFRKLMKACSYAAKPDCMLIASNGDESFPHPDRRVLVPGPGAYVAAIEAVSKKQAIQLGKPWKFFFECIKQVHPDIDCKRAVMIGDRLSTDIPFGKINQLSTLFVQSGIGTYEQMINYKNSCTPEDHLCVPDFYLPSLASLNSFLPA